MYSDTNIIGTVVDHNDGTYTADFTVEETGTYDLIVTLDDEIVTETKIICKSDNNVADNRVTDPSKSEVYGIEDLHSTVTGEQCHFLITSKDHDGISRTSGGDEYTVTLNSDISNETIAGNVVDLNDGTYCVDFAIEKCGTYDLIVALQSEIVTMEPECIVCRDTAQYDYTTGKSMGTTYQNGGDDEQSKSRYAKTGEANVKSRRSKSKRSPEMKKLFQSYEKRKMKGPTRESSLEQSDSTTTTRKRKKKASKKSKLKCESSDNVVGSTSGSTSSSIVSHKGKRRSKSLNTVKEPESKRSISIEEAKRKVVFSSAVMNAIKIQKENDDAIPESVRSLTTRSTNSLELDLNSNNSPRPVLVNALPKYLDGLGFNMGYSIYKAKNKMLKKERKQHELSYQKQQEEEEEANKDTKAVWI
jgi:hypothetical protein